MCDIHEQRHQVVCDSCQHKYCSYCQSQYHFGTSCEEFQNAIRVREKVLESSFVKKGIVLSRCFVAERLKALFETGPIAYLDEVKMSTA